jgi:hypothetical protein
MISLTLQQTELSSGDRLSGRVLWKGDQLPKEVQLVVQWRTEGRGSIDQTKVHKIILPPEGGNFSYQIPPTGPYSYDGQLIRIIWEAQAIAKVGGMLTQTQTATKSFRVNSH